MKFVILALVLLNSDDEEYVRSGISRYYYGVFGIIRRYLINVKGKYYLKSQSIFDWLFLYIVLQFLLCQFFPF